MGKKERFEEDLVPQRPIPIWQEFIDTDLLIDSSQTEPAYQYQAEVTVSRNILVLYELLAQELSENPNVEGSYRIKKRVVSKKTVGRRDSITGVRLTLQGTCDLDFFKKLFSNVNPTMRSFYAGENQNIPTERKEKFIEAVREQILKDK